jgi:hypothetical protein
MYLHTDFQLQNISSVKTQFILFYILLSPVGFLQDPSSSQEKYLDCIFPCIFPFGKSPDGNVRHVHRRQLQYFQNKIIKGKAKNEVSLTKYDEISACTISP